MSKIDALIAELCPDGVEWMTLEDVTFSIAAGGDLPPKYSKGQTSATEEFPYPIYSNGIDEKSVYGFTDNYRINSEAVTISARGTIGWHTIRPPKFTPIVRLIVLIPKTNLISCKFLNYILDITEILHSGGSIPQLTVPNVKKIKIPVPPLPVQEEIVRILDAFTALEAELEAELEARKQQYAYYRDELLSFGDDVARVRLGLLCNVGVGQLPIENQVGEYPFVNAGTTPSGYLSAYNTEPDTVTTPSRGQGGIGYVDYQNKHFWCGPLCYRISTKDERITTRFIYYVMSSRSADIIALANMTGVPALNRKELVDFPLPLPPLEEQTRIVAILDKFDALVNDLSSGLPAEIAARRQQYEHYRNKLLTFTERV